MKTFLIFGHRPKVLSTEPQTPVKWATTSTCEVRILFGMFYTPIDRGGPVNRTLKMAPDHVSETQTPHSFFDFGPFDLFTPVDHLD